MKMFLILLFCVSYTHTRTDWTFKFSGSKKETTPLAGQLSTLNVDTIIKCAVKCTKTQYCQSVSYNEKTKQCVLQSTLSTDKYLKPVPDPDFFFGDMVPPLPEDQRMPCKLLSPCQNNGTCIDKSGLYYVCNCSHGLLGQNCTEAQVLLIGGQLSTSSFEIYDINHSENSCAFDNALNKLRLNAASATFNDGKILIIGGAPNPQPTYIFDPEAETLTSDGLPVLSYESAATVILDDVPIVCGGLGPTDTCRKLVFDQNAQQWNWTTMASMKTARSHFQMLVHGDKVYAIGGSGDIDTVERYNKTADTWELVASMNIGRSSMTAAVLNDKIYVCGGGGSDTRSCEKYDPASDTWMFIAAMKYMRIGSYMTAVFGKLYIFGGEHARHNVEMYDPRTNGWIELAGTISPRRFATGQLLV